MSKTKSSINDLPTLLQSLLAQAEASYPDRTHRVYEVWGEAVGPDLARRSWPLSLRNGRLAVAVSTASWMQQLSFLRETIRDTLNRALGAELVREVRLRLAEAQPEPPTHAPAPPPRWLAMALPQVTVERLRREVAPITDPDLREALLQVRLRSEQVRRFREAPEDAPLPVHTACRRRGE